MDISLTCEDTGNWMAVFTVDTSYQFIWITDGAEYVDTLPIQSSFNTVEWHSDNAVYPNGFWAGYDLVNLTYVDTTHCGTTDGMPNPDQPRETIIPPPPPTDMVIPIDGGAIVYNEFILFVAIIALVMRLIGKKI